MNLTSVSIVLFLISAILGVVAYVFYFKDTNRSSIKPNKWSWLIFSITTLLEALTFNEVSGDLLKSSVFFVSAFCCVAVTILIWSRAEWQKPDWTEWFCLVASAVAVVVWIGFGDAWWAHLIMIISVPIAFLPIYREAISNWQSEYTPAWSLWTLGDLAALILVLYRLDIIEEVPYALVEMLAHATVWYLVMKHRRKHFANVVSV